MLSFTPEPIVFKATAGGEVLPLLGTLLFVALLIERALEVFVNTWRSAGAKFTDERCRRPYLAALGRSGIAGPIRCDTANFLPRGRRVVDGRPAGRRQ